jgi:hypothetical protein
MGLIDKEQLLSSVSARLEYVEKRKKMLAKQLNLFMVDGAIAGELRRLKSTIENAQTVDAAPVVHARWVHRCRYIATEIWEWRCSACGELPPGPNQLAYELRYCPRCGAKMDAEEVRPVG